MLDRIPLRQKELQPCQDSKTASNMTYPQHLVTITSRPIIPVIPIAPSIILTKLGYNIETSISLSQNLIIKKPFVGLIIFNLIIKILAELIDLKSNIIKC